MKYRKGTRVWGRSYGTIACKFSFTSPSYREKNPSTDHRSKLSAPDVARPGRSERHDVTLVDLVKAAANMGQTWECRASTSPSRPSRRTWLLREPINVHQTLHSPTVAQAKLRHDSRWSTHQSSNSKRCPPHYALRAPSNISERTSMF